MDANKCILILEGKKHQNVDMHILISTVGSLETSKFGCEDIYFNIGRQETFKFRSFRLSFSVQREVSENHPIMDEIWMQVNYHFYFQWKYI